MREHLVRPTLVDVDHRLQDRASARPALAPWATRALTSFGRQLPPKPQPASRNEVIGACRPVDASGTSDGVQAAHHVDDVDVADGGAQVGDLVRERDHRRQQRVRGVLDHLRRRRASCGRAARPESPRRAPRAPSAVRSSTPPSTMRSGCMKSCDRLALGEELRVHRRRRSRRRPALPEASSRTRRDDVVGRPGHDRALDDDDVVAVLARGAPRRSARAAARTAARSICVAVERRADGDHRHVGARDGLGEVGRRAEALADVALRAARRARPRGSAPARAATVLDRSSSTSTHGDVVTLARPGRRR